MTDGKPARIVSFSKEQGFGRVAVDDEGELVFDSASAACQLDELVAGADVLVQTGPSRVPGQRKVMRLWRAGSPMPRANPEPAAPEHFESLGPYRFLMPPFWPEGSVRDKNPLWTSTASINDAACVFVVLVGGASDANAKADLVAARSAGARATRCDTQTLGLSFEGHRFDRGAEIELLHVLVAAGDLLTITCRFAAGNAEGEKLVPLLLTMTAAAVHRRGPALLSPAPPAPEKRSEGGFWKRLFGG